ncbi:hypothetical protein M0811_05631 [Anaeramoeba ignava]|uniref:Uncharacterized protein n=1 Tax=Anaeramoeba ignava TaxID=1746090 RepID=A0A9Q0REU5_ANAIG|nr:hypothetical protein M0811_05631 [Anaeramoeba ignava]
MKRKLQQKNQKVVEVRRVKNLKKNTSRKDESAVLQHVCLMITATPQSWKVVKASFIRMWTLETLHDQICTQDGLNKISQLQNTQNSIAQIYGFVCSINVNLLLDTKLRTALLHTDCKSGALILNVSCVLLVLSCS